MDPASAGSSPPPALSSVLGRAAGDQACRCLLGTHNLILFQYPEPLGDQEKTLVFSTSWVNTRKPMSSRDVTRKPYATVPPPLRGSDLYLCSPQSVAALPLSMKVLEWGWGKQDNTLSKRG